MKQKRHINRNEWTVHGLTTYPEKNERKSIHAIEQVRAHSSYRRIFLEMNRNSAWQWKQFKASHHKTTDILNQLRFPSLWIHSHICIDFCTLSAPKKKWMIIIFIFWHKDYIKDAAITHVNIIYMLYSRRLLFGWIV